MIAQVQATNQPCAVVVTGASSGIGSALAGLLAARGYPVIAIARDAARLAALASHSPRIVAVPFDLARIEAIDAFTEQLLARHPDIGALINNAGIQDNVRLDDTSYRASAIANEINVNLAAPIALTRALLPHLQGRSRAVVVNVTSGLAFVPKRTSAVYSATKAGLHLFTEALRVQCQGGNVRVVEAVMPLVDTAMTAGRGHGKIAPELAAAALADGLWTGPQRLYIGKARALPMLLRVAPTFAASLMQRD